MSDTQVKAVTGKVAEQGAQARTAATDAGHPTGWEDVTEGFGPDFKPLSAEEAQRWRVRQVPVSLWRVVGIQSVAGVFVALAAWGLGGSVAHGWSAAWGALAVVLPAMLFARGLSRSGGQAADAGTALMRLMFWEAVKVVVTLAMLLVAPRVVPSLSWMALVVGFVVTLKMYWLAWWLHARRPAGRP